MGFAESGLTIIAGGLMIIVLIISLIPVLPGPFLLWLISLVYGLLTGFDHLTGLAMVVITLLMVTGMSKDFWMPLIGMKRTNASCSTVFGMFVGGVIGTFALPIPVIGTLIGAVVGAMILELLNVGEFQKAFRAGGFAFKTFMLGMVTEFGFNLLIVLVFFGSLITTR